MPQYNRAELGRMGTESGFVRYTFEKVIRLKEIFAAKGNALITRAVAESSFLFYFLTYNASGITIYLTIRLNVK